MNTRRLVIFILFISIFIMAARVSIDVTDTWWHLATGRYITEHQTIPLTDPFSQTRLGSSWKGAAVGWLAQLTYYGIFQLASFGGLNIFVALMVTLAFFFIYKAMRGEVFFKAFTLIIAAAAAGVYWSARPYMFSFVLFAVYLWILEDYRWGRAKRLWLLPILQMLWANLHGGWVYGPIIFAIYAIAEGIKWLLTLWNQETKRIQINKAWWQAGIKGSVGQLLLIALFIFLAIAINPAGPSMWAYPFETVSIQALQDVISEWQSPNFHTAQVQPFVWMILIAFVAIGASDRKLELVDFLLFSIFTYLALFAGRNIAQFALVLPVVISHYAESALARLRKAIDFTPLANIPPTRFQNIFNSSIAIILFLVVPLKIITIYPDKINQDHIDTIVPVHLVDYMQENELEGKVFNSYNWGGYLIWMAPEYPVFVDGRTDLYGDEVIGNWMYIIGGAENWNERLEALEIDLILMESHWGLNAKLQKPDSGWTLLMEDEMGVLYQRAED